MGVDFWQTGMGRRLIEGTLPQMVKSMDGLSEQVRLLSKAMEKTEPGEMIGESTCPCCGAKLEVMHGEDEGMVAIVGEAWAEGVELSTVPFRGGKVRVGWPEQLLAAQREKSYVLGGKKYARKPFEAGEADEVCHDCRAADGELHVPGCDMERCPKCHGQAISCGCKE